MVCTEETDGHAEWPSLTVISLICSVWSGLFSVVILPSHKTSFIFLWCSQASINLKKSIFFHNWYNYGVLGCAVVIQPLEKCSQVVMVLQFVKRVFLCNNRSNCFCFLSPLLIFTSVYNIYTNGRHIHMTLPRGVCGGCYWFTFSFSKLPAIFPFKLSLSIHQIQSPPSHVFHVFAQACTTQVSA